MNKHSEVGLPVHFSIWLNNIARFRRCLNQQVKSEYDFNMYFLKL